MLFGVQKTERILGLHPRPCGQCRPAADRLVTRRRWAAVFLGVPVVALDARWRRCTGCTRRFAVPRLSLPTTIFASLVLAWLLGLGAVVYGDLFVWVLLILFWGTFLLGHVLDSLLDDRLVAVPPALYRSRKPAAVKRGAGTRAKKSLARQRPVGRIRRIARAARGTVRLVRKVRRRGPPAGMAAQGGP